MDELEKGGNYTCWQKDFDLVQELGIRFLRYGPPIHTTFLGPGKYDWAAVVQSWVISVGHLIYDV